MKAVLFDLFETLVSHFDPDWRPPARTTAQRLGLPQALYDERWPALDKRWQRGELPTYPVALRELYAAAGARPDEAAIAELERDYVAYADRTAFVPPEPAIVAMLESLRGSGLALAIVTNANDLDAAPWPRHGLARFFDVFVSSHEEKLLKPDRRIYQLACTRLGLSPGDAVFVGDGGSDELRGAAEAGIEPLWCSWFLDRWPEGIRPNGFAGDEWRQHPSRREAPFPRLQRPEDLPRLLKRGT